MMDDPVLIALAGIALMIVLMMLKMPVGFAMLLAGVVGNIFVMGTEGAFHLLAGDVWGQFASYGLSVIPLFVLMGNFVFRAGVTDSLYRAAYQWIGHLPGGLAATTLLASMGFSAVCGSNSATTATVGTIALPEMRKYKYDKVLAGASVAVGGTLGVVIPPSVVLLVIAVQTEQSIGKLFVAAIIPGLILTHLFLATVYLYCRRNPELGPAGPLASWSARLSSLAGLLDILLLFLLVIGGMYAGWFTPTEAAAAGAFGALVLPLLRRRLSWENFRLALFDSLRVSSMVVLMVAGAVVFGRFLTVTRLPFVLADWAAALPVPPFVILSVIALIYLIGGCLMDALGFLVVTIPIFFPVAMALGYDPVWYTILITILTTMGAITPPVGVNVFIVHGLAPEIPVHSIFRGIGLFVAAYAACIVLIWVFPQIVLWLPSLMY